MDKKSIIDAYCRIRTIDNTIPDDVLDFMKDSALAALEHSPKPDVSEVPCDHPATDSDAIGIYCSVCNKRLYGG
jgi:hypothetical protein